MKKTGIITIILLMFAFITSYLSTNFYEVLKIAFNGIAFEDNFDLPTIVMNVFNIISFITLCLAAISAIFYFLLCLKDLFKRDK